eukprot:GHVR01160904.1.p1 GENE.GHVR01160904.1~~GHVR01160904.1.p1  ORF type:complete len:1051 (+),score=356.19 GHVR01160904.1:2601-5753(+)
MCLQVGSQITWTISDESYPIYVKDSLLNTAVNFDVSPFDELINLIENSNNNVPILFTITFSYSGVYVFSTSSKGSNGKSNIKNFSIVAIVPIGQNCPTSGHSARPITAEAMRSIGVKRRGDIVIEPNWVLVVIISSLVILLIFIMVLIILRFKSNKWIIHNEIIKCNYRNNSLKYNFNYFDSIQGDIQIKKYNLNENNDNDDESDIDTLSTDYVDANTVALSLSQYSLDLFDDRLMQATFEKLLDHYKYFNILSDESLNITNTKNINIRDKSKKWRDTLDTAVLLSERKSALLLNESETEASIKLNNKIKRLKEVLNNVPNNKGCILGGDIIDPKLSEEFEEDMMMDDAIKNNDSLELKASSDLGIGALDAVEGTLLLNNLLPTKDINQLNININNINDKIKQCTDPNELKILKEQLNINNKDKIFIDKYNARENNIRENETNRLVKQQQLREDVETNTQKLLEALSSEEAQKERVREAALASYHDDIKNDKIDILQLNSNHDANAAVSRQELKRRMDDALSGVSSNEERQQILIKYAEEQKLLETELENNYRIQQDKLNIKLQERAKKKLNKDIQTHKQQINAASLVSQNAQKDVLSSTRDELIERQKDENIICNENIILQEETGERGIDGALHKAREEAHIKLKKELNTLLDTEVDQNVKDKLIKQYEIIQMEADNILDNEAQLQRDETRKRLSERSKKRLDAVKKRHECEKTNLEIESVNKESIHELDNKHNEEILLFHKDIQYNRSKIMKDSDIDISIKLKQLESKKEIQMMDIKIKKDINEKQKELLLTELNKQYNIIKDNMIIENDKQLNNKLKQLDLDSNIKMQNLREKQRNEREILVNEINLIENNMMENISEILLIELEAKKEQEIGQIDDTSQCQLFQINQQNKIAIEIDIRDIKRKENKRIEKLLVGTNDENEKDKIRQSATNNINNMIILLNDEYNEQSISMKLKLDKRLQLRKDKLETKKNAELNNISVKQQHILKQIEIDKEKERVEFDLKYDSDRIKEDNMKHHMNMIEDVILQETHKFKKSTRYIFTFTWKDGW